MQAASAHESSAAAPSVASAYYSGSGASASAGASSGAAQADSERGFRGSDVHARLGYVWPIVPRVCRLR